MTEENWAEARLIDTPGGHHAVEVRLWPLGTTPRIPAGRRIAVTFRETDMRHYRVCLVSEGAQERVREAWRRQRRTHFLGPRAIRAGCAIFPVMPAWPYQNGWLESRTPWPSEDEEPEDDPVVRGW